MPYNPNYSPKKNQRDLYESFSTKLPVETLKLLKLKAIHDGVTIASLINIAVDNELDCDPAFTYECPLTDTPSEYMNVKECKLVINLLSRTYKGMLLSTLVIARRDIGIPNKDKILEVISELHSTKVISVFLDSGNYRCKLLKREMITTKGI